MKKFLVVMIAFMVLFFVGNVFAANKEAQQEMKQDEITKTVYAFRSLKDGSTFYFLSDEKKKGFEFKGPVFYIIVDDLVYAPDKNVSSKDNK